MALSNSWLFMVGVLTSSTLTPISSMYSFLQLVRSEAEDLVGYIWSCRATKKWVRSEIGDTAVHFRTKIIKTLSKRQYRAISGGGGSFEIWKLNNNGERIPHCGTACLILLSFDVWPRDPNDD